MLNYSFNLAWSEEDSCYIATSSEFPLLSAFGETPDEALKEARVAMEGILQVYEEDGCPIPEPKTQKTFSGQTRLRLPKTLHATLHHEAAEEGVSLNTYIVTLLSQRHSNKRTDINMSELYNLFEKTLLQSCQLTINPHENTTVSNHNIESNWPSRPETSTS